MCDGCGSFFRSYAYSLTVAFLLLIIANALLQPLPAGAPVQSGLLAAPSLSLTPLVRPPSLPILAGPRSARPPLCADRSYGWSDADAGGGSVSLLPRQPGEATRPVGFPPWGTRTLVVEEIGRKGLADRMSNLKHALLLARFLGANLSAPRPCDSLSSAHSGSLPPCSVGWDRYVSSRQPFHGYASGDDAALAPPPPCVGKQLAWPLLAAGAGRPAALDSSFCLSLSGLVFHHKEDIRSFSEALAASVWGCPQPVNASVDAAEAHEQLGYSEAVLLRAEAILREYTPPPPLAAALPPGAPPPPLPRFGVIHVRRGDRRNFLPCSELPHVLDTFQRAVAAAGAAAQGIPWFLFSLNQTFADELWTQLVALGLVEPSKLLLETTVPELNTQAFGGAGVDNYFAMRIMHWLMQHATVSIRTSATYEWMWAGDGRPRPEGGANSAGAAAQQQQQQQWVYHLCE